MKKVTELYEILTEQAYFTDAELELLTNINGYNIQTLNDAIYARYGYRDYEQLQEVYGIEKGDSKKWQD